jgi:outer membrane lipoprotein SlyB
VPIEDQLIVSAPRAEAGATIGAITGAILGAILSSGSNGGDRGEATLDFAFLGAWIGTASDDHRNEKYEDLMAMQEDDMANQAAEYRRAVGACLGGRGYSVK